MDTKKNLEDAFSGESKASRLYFAFAEKAEKEGYKNIARLLKAAAFSETIHARNHLNALKSISSTADNLKKAVEGEAYEVADMYPRFISIAEEEGNDEAVRTFNWAYETEMVHKEYFEEALQSIEANTDIAEEEMVVCSNCGYTMLGEIPERCPICGAPKSMFARF